MIGAFTLAVIAAAFMFVFWFSGARTREGVKTYNVEFTSSVSGLSRGARVLFNGLNVGEVKSLDLSPNDPGKVIAKIEVKANTPVKTDTRARLESQGLTGVASIALIGGTPRAADVAGNAENPPLISAESSEIQNILATLQRLTGKVDSAMVQVEKLITDNSASISNTIKNAEKFSQALGENSDGVKKFMASVSDLGKTLKPVAANLEVLTKNLNERIAAIEPKQLKSIVANADKVASSLATSADKFNKLVSENSGAINETVKNAQTFSKALASNAGDVKNVMATLAEVSKTLGPAVKSLRSVADNIDTRIKAIEPKKLASFIDNADKLASRLSGSVDKFDKLIDANATPLTETVKNAQTFSKALAGNSGNVKEVMTALAGVSKTIAPVVASLQRVTSSINQRISAIEPKQLSSLVANADKVAGQLSQSIKKFDTFFEANSGPLTETVKNAQDFSKVLAGNKAGINKLITSLSELGKTLEPAVKNFETITRDISKRVAAVDETKLKEIVDNAGKISSKLVGSADKLDKVLTGVEKLLGSGESKGAMKEVAEAAKAIRILARNLDARTRVMSRGINRFTGAGLRQYEALAADGRRTLRQLDSTIKSLKKNPQQVIFGAKPAIPEYSGR